MRRLALFFVAVLAGIAGTTGAAASSYVSQRADRAYLREGPSYAHRVLWIYRHRGYPFRVVARFDVWRRVEAPDGAVGWMSATMLSDQRTVLITGKGRAAIHDKPDGGKLVGLADPGAVAAVKACGPAACHIKSEEIDGWVPRDRLWGVDPGETFK